MTDEEWTFFEHFILTTRAPNGRKPANHRLVLDGIFWIARTGSPWRDLPEPKVLLADRGYDADRIRKTMDERDIITQIPMRKTRVGVDHRLYWLRNMVERCFNKLKNARRVAIRYDKTAERFLGFIHITSIRLWLRHLST